jgi:hypothetical protein
VTVIERYTEWYCYFFALAVHELTGWRIVDVGEHFMCMTPDERFFDVRGFSDHDSTAKATSCMSSRSAPANTSWKASWTTSHICPQARVDA